MFHFVNPIGLLYNNLMTFARHYNTLYKMYISCEKVIDTRFIIHEIIIFFIKQEEPYSAINN